MSQEIDLSNRHEFLRISCGFMSFENRSLFNEAVKKQKLCNHMAQALSSPAAYVGMGMCIVCRPTA